MTRFLLAGAAAAAFVVPAFAQPAPPAPPGVAQGTNPVPTVPRVRVETRVERMPMMMPETRAEVVAHVREMFAKLDINRDGFVTRDEAEAAHKMMGGEMHRGMDRPMADGAMPPLPPMPHMDRKAMFDRLDTNHDGMISRQEFDAHAQIREERRVVMHRGPDGKLDMAGMGRMHAMAMRMHSRMFDMADANHDGKVSLQEMTDAALRHFDMADANHDGRITPEERMQMHQRMKEMKRPA
jgi:Ca2+-binding EF-hand superfamily protein